MVKINFENPFTPGLELKRYPDLKNPTLQAWDSADELILDHLSGLDLKNKRILIINDHFGALTLSLNAFNPQTYSDSYVSCRAIECNGNNSITASHKLEELSGIYDLVILRIPKNSSFLEDILCRLSRHLGSSSKLIFGSMVKHLSTGSFKLIEKNIGPTSTSLAKKKARLIFADFQKHAVQTPYPISISIESFEHPFIHHSNLFSREKLDIGTRFLLDHIPQGDYKCILDLGCANGIVGIKSKLLNPHAQIIFSDDSFMALESAQLNYHNYFSEPATFKWINCYEDQVSESVDLILCNPPFHQEHTMGDFVASAMFQDAFKALKKGGLFRVIGNSHLNYQQKLKTIFPKSFIKAKNEKFIIIDSIKT